MFPQKTFDDFFASAHNALAKGAFSQAVQLFTQCIHLQANHPEAWFLLGASLDRCGKRLEAAQAFARTESLQPSHPQAANALATMLSLLGNNNDALTAFRRALALNPGNAQILTNIGIASERQGRADEALANYDAALASEPDHLGALSNRGTLLLKLKRPQQALNDHLRFVACAPASATGHYNCAESYGALGRDEEGLACCDAALACDPMHAKSRFLRGAFLASAGRFTDAAAALDLVRKLAPATFAEMMKSAKLDTRRPCAVNVRNIYCQRGLSRMHACDWRNYASFVVQFECLIQAGTQNPADAIADFGIPFTALALPLQPQTQLALARQLAVTFAPDCPSVPRLPAYTRNKDKLRIGYVSPDFRNHAVGFLLRDFFHQHDRQTFAVHAYSLQSDKDDPAHDFAFGCDMFHDVAQMQTAEIIELIRSDDIDILVDLAGYTDHARPEIFASRPAPLNILYLGYPGTSGAEWIDYFVTNPVASPSTQAPSFTEKLIYLPDNCFPYPQDQVIDRAKDRQSYGLPQNAFVFCCFNHSYKIEPVVFATWMRLLQRVPDSVLWLYAPQPAVAENLCAEAVAQGVDPARLIFAPLLPLTEHLARYQAADLFLDTFLYGAGTTGMDALWAGLPLLTCPGETYASRFGASHLSALGMTELITASPAEYEARAFHLATHPDELPAIRRKLANQRLQAPLFRTDRLVRQLEAAYKQAWNRHQAGLPPAHIEIH